ncbi:hypothetical protein KNE206_03700 [Kitasatospora sp. NE20-6]
MGADTSHRGASTGGKAANPATARGAAPAGGPGTADLVDIAEGPVRTGSAGFAAPGAATKGVSPSVMT